MMVCLKENFIGVLINSLLKKGSLNAVLLLNCRLLFTSFFSQTAERICKKGNMFEWLYFLNHFMKSFIGKPH
jgi:hypothetical protein